MQAADIWPDQGTGKDISHSWSPRPSGWGLHEYLSPQWRWQSAGGDDIRTDYATDSELDIVLSLLTPANRLACQVSLHTGLRISDVLAIRTDQLRSPRISVRERKTGKLRRVYIPQRLLDRMREQAGEVWVWPNARDPQRHRTRQAVWMDVHRAARAMRARPNIAPHTMRKVYAVRRYQAAHGDLAAVQRALNHSDPAVTLLYALADQLRSQRQREGGRRPSRP